MFFGSDPVVPGPDQAGVKPLSDQIKVVFQKTPTSCFNVKRAQTAEERLRRRRRSHATIWCPQIYWLSLYHSISFSALLTSRSLSLSHYNCSKSKEAAVSVGEWSLSLSPSSCYFIFPGCKCWQCTFLNTTDKLNVYISLRNNSTCLNFTFFFLW